MKGDSIYFAQRAQQERDAALIAQHPAAQRAHREMAQRYEDIAAAVGDGQAMLKMVSAH